VFAGGWQGIQQAFQLPAQAEHQGAWRNLIVLAGGAQRLLESRGQAPMGSCRGSALQPRPQPDCSRSKPDCGGCVLRVFGAPKADGISQFIRSAASRSGGGHC